jgi:hypothetical protein
VPPSVVIAGAVWASTAVQTARPSARGIEKALPETARDPAISMAVATAVRGETYSKKNLLGNIFNSIPQKLHFLIRVTSQGST